MLKDFVNVRARENLHLIKLAGCTNVFSTFRFPACGQATLTPLSNFGFIPEIISRYLYACKNSFLLDEATKLNVHSTRVMYNGRTFSFMYFSLND